MKKALSLVLVALMLMLALSSCDLSELPLGGAITEDPADGTGEDATGEGNLIKPTDTPETGLSKEDWQEAIAEEKFDNVTIYATVDYDEEAAANTDFAGVMDSSQSIKIVDDTVLRTMKSGEYEMSMFFTDEDAETQRKMFVDVFLALLAERENYVYDPESKTYKAPEKISVTVTPGENSSDLVEMTEGVVTFDDQGRLVKFACTLEETVTTTYEGQTVTRSAPPAETVWTFADYGKTVITDEEKEAGSPSGGVEDEEQVGNEIPAPEEDVAE